MSVPTRIHELEKRVAELEKKLDIQLASETQKAAEQGFSELIINPEQETSESEEP